MKNPKTGKEFRAPYARSRGLITPAPLWTYYLKHDYTLSNGTHSYASSPTSVIIPGGKGRAVEDTVTPGYRYLSAQGMIINNGFSISAQDWGVNPYSGPILLYSSKTDVSSTYDTLQDFIPDPRSSLFATVSIPELESLRQDAINKAFAKSHQRDVLGMVDLAEMGKTIDMLKGNLGRFEKLVTGVPLTKKLRRISKSRVYKYESRTPFGRLADISGLHLEVQYGVLPLMFSIKGLMNVLSDQAKPQRSTFRSNVRISDTLSGLGIATDNGFGTMTPYPLGRKIRYFHTIDYSFTGRAGVMTEYKPTVREALGTTIRDLPTAGYELIPFSFVLDWVFDLGSAIEALTPVPGFKALASWFTSELSETHRYTVQSEGASQSSASYQCNWYPYSADVFITNYLKYRTPGVMPGLPKLDLHFQSLTHAFSGLALMISFINKKARGRL